MSRLNIVNLELEEEVSPSPSVSEEPSEVPSDPPEPSHPSVDPSESDTPTDDIGGSFDGPDYEDYAMSSSSTERRQTFASDGELRRFRVYAEDKDLIMNISYTDKHNKQVTGTFSNPNVDADTNSNYSAVIEAYSIEGGTNIRTIEKLL